MKFEDIVDLERQLEAQLAEMEKTRAKLEAVRLARLTWEEMKGGAAATQLVVDSSQSNTGNSGVKTSKRYGKIAGSVREFVNGMTSPFKLDDVVHHLESSGKLFASASIRTVLVRMEKQGLVKVIEKGRGRSPSVFSATLASKTAH